MSQLSFAGFLEQMSLYICVNQVCTYPLHNRNLSQGMIEHLLGRDVHYLSLGFQQHNHMMIFQSTFCP